MFCACTHSCNTTVSYDLNIPLARRPALRTSSPRSSGRSVHTRKSGLQHMAMRCTRATPRQIKEFCDAARIKYTGHVASCSSTVRFHPFPLKQGAQVDNMKGAPKFFEVP
eukprot:6276282-Amphidinium_carterae.1